MLLLVVVLLLDPLLPDVAVGPTVVTSFQFRGRSFRSLSSCSSFSCSGRFLGAACEDSKGKTRSSSSTRLDAAPALNKKLGLLTFDLDDTLYPIADVLKEANSALVTAMKSYGFDGIQPSDIDRAARELRQSLPAEESLVMSHTEVRRRAIRREMEKIILDRKLHETADDWATPVSDLSPIVVNFAKK